MPGKIPVPIPELRTQAVMVSLTYEDVVALDAIMASIIEAKITIPEGIEDLAVYLRAKFGACALSLETMYNGDRGE